MNSASVILLFILHLAFYSFLTYFDNEKRETITKIKKILYFNEI